MMTRKWASLSKGMLFTWGMLLGLTFLFLVPRDAAGRLQHTYARVFRWPLTAGSGLTRVARTIAQERTISSREYEELLKACQQLRNESANLQAQLQETNKQIELLTKLRARPGLEHMRAIPARVVTQGKDELTIDRGQESGVAVGQCVMSLTDARLNDQCVIGIVSGVFSDGARVRLITYPKCGTPVGIGKLNMRKVMEGLGDGTARIPLVPCSYAVEVGNAVYAERKPCFLDVPIIAAEVAQCQTDPENPLMWNIIVRPVCDVAGLLDVVVMKPASVP
jgi:cell shape-determining protein MreC